MQQKELNKLGRLLHRNHLLPDKWSGLTAPLRIVGAQKNGFEQSQTFLKAADLVSQTDLVIWFETVAAERTARRPSAGGTTSFRTTVIIHQITSILTIKIPSPSTCRKADARATDCRSAFLRHRSDIILAIHVHVARQFF